MTKKQAREHFLRKRQELSDNEIEISSLRIFNQWKNSALTHFDSYHIFLPIKEKKEVLTSFFIEFLWMHHKKVYCSKVHKGILLHYEFTPQTQLKENSWGIPEPTDPENVTIKNIDCVFVPLLAYDVSGNRTGYGKGYYDRFLADFPDCKKIGLSFFNPVVQIEDIATWDVPLDYIITPDYCSGFPIEEK
ncbi:MAG: 5-formyltetrahydrofolate cyclo-ligase [Flavobacteriaceae bacterium]|jgi:5-formyltetrahydrofolate cyclo-ligase|nr:5-formyltetrahydrofolate cyclo-ligase [Flavobacteriaceae bacterium]